MRVALESPDQPEVIRLIAELDRHQHDLYPPESRHPLDLAGLKRPNVLFAVARDAAGVAVGCGAAVIHAGFAELKRMYVQPPSRGRGIAQALLALLEAGAGSHGCNLLKLETGVKQPEALAFYARSGYQRRGPFAQYRDDPSSVFMQKRIDPGAASHGSASTRAPALRAGPLRKV